MALPNSFIAGQTLHDALANTIALDLEAATGDFQCSLWKDSWAQSIVEETTTDYYGTGIWASGNGEWLPTGMTAGGGTAGEITAPLLSTVADSRAVIWYDSTGYQLWTGLTDDDGNPSGVLITDTINSRPLAFVNFGADFGISGGEFQITWDSTNGIIKFTY